MNLWKIYESYKFKPNEIESTKFEIQTKYFNELCFSDTELIMLGGFGGAGNNLMNTVENYNIEGELIETLPVMNVARQLLIH